VHTDRVKTNQVRAIPSELLVFFTVHKQRTLQRSLFHQTKITLSLENFNLLIVQTPPASVTSSLSRPNLRVYSKIILYIPVYLTYFRSFKIKFFLRRIYVIFIRHENVCLQSKHVALMYCYLLVFF
jgi:hypothetical protein